MAERPPTSPGLPLFFQIAARHSQAVQEVTFTNGDPVVPAADGD
jgi:hypothetical protein